MNPHRSSNEPASNKSRASGFGLMTINQHLLSPYYMSGICTCTFLLIWQAHEEAEC